MKLALSAIALIILVTLLLVNRPGEQIPDSLQQTCSSLGTTTPAPVASLAEAKHQSMLIAYGNFVPSGESDFPSFHVDRVLSGPQRYAGATLSLCGDVGPSRSAAVVFLTGLDHGRWVPLEDDAGIVRPNIEGAYELSHLIWHEQNSIDLKALTRRISSGQ